MSYKNPLPPPSEMIPAIMDFNPFGLRDYELHAGKVAMIAVLLYVPVSCLAVLAFGLWSLR